MEDQPLNRAHQEERKANRHLQNKRFDDAVHCHLLAAKFLEDAMTYTRIPRALESLHLQKKYHLRQLQIIRLKKAQLNTLTTAIQKKLETMAHINSTLNEEDLKESDPIHLQTAIFRTMEEADSLFEILVQKADEIQSQPHPDGIPVESSSLPSCQGSKRPKEDHVVIEELHTLNQQLRCFVEQLMTELRDYEEENKKLKIRIKELENEHKNCQNASEHKTVSLPAIGNSSGSISSPFSQLSPNMAGKHELPALAPLEIPNFDYSLRSNPETERNLN